LLQGSKYAWFDGEEGVSELLIYDSEEIETLPQAENALKIPSKSSKLRVFKQVGNAIVSVGNPDALEFRRFL